MGLHRAMWGYLGLYEVTQGFMGLVILHIPALLVCSSPRQHLKHAGDSQNPYLKPWVSSSFSLLLLEFIAHCRKSPLTSLPWALHYVMWPHLGFGPKIHMHLRSRIQGKLATICNSWTVLVPEREL